MYNSLLSGFRFVLRRREQATKRIDENQKTSDSSSIEIHNSPAENSTKNVDQETKKKKFNIFEPTEYVYNEADPIEESDSQHVYNISKSHRCNKKQNFDKNVMYNYLFGNPLHMCENECDFQRPMLDSSTTSDEHIF